VSTEDPVYADLHERRTSPGSTLDTIIDWSLAAVLGSDAGIVLMRSKNRMETCAPTSERLRAVHDLQLSLREGPSYEVIADDHPGSIVIGDTASDPRFPLWGRCAADAGLRSVITSVLRTRDDRFGSLNVYARQPHAFDLDDLEAIDVFARRAARAIVIAEEAHGREVALDSRKLIGQAQGMLMERFAIDGERAFELLVRLSQQHNVKLRSVADLLIRHPAAGLEELSGLMTSQS
jgi:GAF domain-containing protein